LQAHTQHPFYSRVNEILEKAKFDRYADRICRKYYAERMGRPSLTPGTYFRCFFVGYLEGIDSERGIAYRVSDSLGLREFFGLSLEEKNLGVDATTLEANAALKSIVRRNDGNSYDEHVGELMKAEGMAIANPSSRNVVATADVLDEFGNLISRETLSLNSYTHQAFSIADEWPSTAGRRGSIEFQTSGFGIGVLGLRFSPYGSFTSFNILTNFSWIAQ